MANPISTHRITSIKTKLTLTVLVTVTLLLVAMLWVLYLYVHSIMSKSIMSQQATLVTEIADQLDGRIQLARHQLSLATTEIDSRSIHDPKKLDHILNNVSSIQMIFDGGFLVVGADGKVLSEQMGLPDLLGSDLSFRNYVSEAMKTGKPVLSSPFRLSVPPHIPMIAMAVPVRDNSDRILCLLVGYHTLGTDQFLTNLSTKHLGTGGYLYLLHGRTILMHPDKSRILETIPQGANAGIDKALQGFEGSLQNVNSKGKHMLSSFKRIGETGWILGANIPYDEAFKPLSTLARNAVVIALIGVVISLLIVWYVARRLTHPIRQLTSHVDAVNAAEYAWRPIELRTGDEIERLADAFNAMMNEVTIAKQQLKEEKDFYSGIIQNTAAPLFVLDRNHTVIFWNNAMATLTGKSSLQMTGTRQQWSPFYPEKRPVLADLVLDKSMDMVDVYYNSHSMSQYTDGSPRAEGWYDNLGGKRRYIFFEAAPVCNSSNEVVAVVETLEDITDRKLAEEETAAHNSFLQTIIDAIPNPIFYKNSSGLYVGCNRAFTSFFGKEPTEIFGHSLLDIMPEEYANASMYNDRLILESGHGTQYESELMRGDGSVRTVLISKAPYSHGDGVIAGIVGAFVDVTEQRTMDEQIRKMSRAIEQSPATIVITDVNGDIEYVNPKFCQTTGYTAEEALGKNPRVLKSGEMQPEGYSELWTTISSGREWRGEFHNKRKDGTLFWEFASISPLFGKDSQVVGYLAIKEDITDRKLIEAKLAQNSFELEAKHEELEQLFMQVEHAKREWEQTLDHLRDFVILTDPEHRIIRFNKLLADISGKTYDNIIGVDWRELINDSGFRFVSFNGQNGEVFHQRSGRSYDIVIYPINENGAATGHVISINDTTDLRATTQELEKAYAELKEAQLQIFQQEKMASIGQLAAGVAHEINNPMGFISSNLGTLNKYIDRLAEFIGAADQSMIACAGSDVADKLKEVRKRLKVDYVIDDSRQLIAESQDGAGRVRRIVQDLKSFSRVDQAECALINLNEALETTINIAWNEIKYVATLNREFGDIPQIKCFPQQLNQVFLNLLVNAAHAIGENQGSITVRTWSEAENVLVSVSDSGCGIPDEIQKRIFEPFFTTKEVGKGTGLGLSISYDIIRKHGGEITVESEVGRGTSFIVRLPVDGVETDGEISASPANDVK